MRKPTEKEVAEGWRGLNEYPPEGVAVDVMGSDFMGDWQGTATLKVIDPRGPRVQWKGTGWMGTRPRTLSKGDVELWRPKSALEAEIAALKRESR